MRIVCFGFNRILVRTMETKSPYFSPKKTRNFVKKESLSLLQKVTQPNKPVDSNSTDKKCVRVSKVKAESSTHVAAAKPKTGKKRVYNIRIDGASGANQTIKKEPEDTAETPQTGSAAIRSLKTPEKQQNATESTSVLNNAEAAVTSMDVKIKFEPPEEGENISLPICEKTPVKQEPVDYLSPAKRELPDRNDDTTAIAKEAKWEPENWRQMMENIRQMRRMNPAPVDTMGCDQFTQDSEAVLPDRLKRYHCLVSLMLSSQTKDQANHECMLRLKKHGLTPETIVATDSAVLQKLIYPVGFYKVCGIARISLSRCDGGLVYLLYLNNVNRYLEHHFFTSPHFLLLLSLVMDYQHL